MRVWSLAAGAVVAALVARALDFGVFVDHFFKHWIPTAVLHDVVRAVGGASCLLARPVEQDAPAWVLVNYAKAGVAAGIKAGFSLAFSEKLCYTAGHHFPLTHQDLEGPAQRWVNVIPYNRAMSCYLGYCADDVAQAGERPYLHSDMRGLPAYRAVTVTRDPLEWLRSFYAYIITEPEYAFCADRPGVPEGFRGFAAYAKSLPLDAGLAAVWANPHVRPALEAMAASHEQRELDRDLASVRFELLQQNWTQFWGAVFDWWRVGPDAQRRMLQGIAHLDLSEDARRTHRHVTTKADPATQAANEAIRAAIRRAPFWPELVKFRARLGYTD